MFLWSVPVHSSSIVITEPWAQDAISYVVYVWAFALHGCVMQLTRYMKTMASSGGVTDESPCYIIALLCLLVSAHRSNIVSTNSSTCAISVGLLDYT